MDRIEQIEKLIGDLNMKWTPRPHRPVLAKDASPKQVREHADALEVHAAELEAYEANVKDIAEKRAALHAEWEEALFASRPDLPEQVKHAAHGLAYEDGHSGGLEEVRVYFEKYCDFAATVLKSTSK